MSNSSATPLASSPSRSDVLNCSVMLMPALLRASLRVVCKLVVTHIGLTSGLRGAYGDLKINSGEHLDGNNLVLFGFRHYNQRREAL